MARMLDAKAVRMGLLGAVLAVVAWPLLGMAWFAALWAWSTFGPDSGLVFLDSQWTFEGLGSPSLVGLAETASLAGLGFVVGVVLARRQKPLARRQ
jgi:hypothetical protein